MGVQPILPVTVNVIVMVIKLFGVNRSLGRFTPNDSVTVTLMGGTFDLFDEYCDGRMGFIPILPVNVTIVTESLDVNEP